jgi:hypothetical protein
MKAQVLAMGSLDILENRGMKMSIKLLTSVLLIMLCGCVSSRQSPSASSISQTETDSCSDQPKQPLSPQSVDFVVLADKEEVVSGMVNRDKQMGYIFDAKSGQTLEYQTSDKVCIWIYTPDNKVLGNGRIPRDGKYVVQVSAHQGSTTFNLKMKLVSEPAQASRSTVPTSQSTRAEQSDPEKFIQEYYTAINDRDYKFSWTSLSLKYKQKTGGFSDYTQWWDSVGNVRVNSTSLLRHEKGSAVVEADLLYKMKEGEVIEDEKTRFYLIWNSEENHWDIDDKTNF